METFSWKERQEEKAISREKDEDELREGTYTHPSRLGSTHNGLSRKFKEEL